LGVDTPDRAVFSDVDGIGTLRVSLRGKEQTASDRTLPVQDGFELLAGDDR
jgi:hypothetical protein